MIDEFLPKVEEWVQESGGKIRADKAHEKLVALGYAGSGRTNRRAALSLAVLVLHGTGVTGLCSWRP